MKFERFKEMSKDYGDFISMIVQASKEYCLLKGIEDPLEDYSLTYWWYEDNIIFDIDETDITILYGVDIGRYGETDWEARTLTIPISFFNLETKDTTALEEKQRTEKLKKYKEELYSYSAKIKEKIRDKDSLNRKKISLESDCQRYGIVFNSTEFTKLQIEKDRQIDTISKKIADLNQEIEQLKEN